MGFFLKEGRGPLKVKGIWKYVLTNKAVFLNKDLRGHLTGDKSSTHRLLLEGHISVLLFLWLLFPGHAQLCCAAETGSFQPRTTRLEHFQLQQIAAAGQPLGRGQNSVSASQVIPRLPKH